ncbi:MAG: hypothetical protein R3C18_18540 [Planctomycetaceae bacterium]
MTDKTVSADKGFKPPDDKNERPHPAVAVLAGFMLAFVLLGCCVCGGGAWWFRPQLNDDDELVDPLTQDIVDIDIPKSFVPKGTITWNVAFTMWVRGAYYELLAGDGVLSIVEVRSRFRAEEDVRQHIRKTLLEKGGGGSELVIDDSLTTQKLYDIRGQEVPFLFQIGEDRTRRDHRYHIIEGVFDGKNGEVLISLRIDDDSWSEPEVETLLQSLTSQPEDEVVAGDEPTPAEPVP